MSTNVNSAVIKLTRGRAVNLGTLTATTQAIVFTISEPTRDSQGFLIIQTNGTAGTTPTLEGSIDGGQTWFVLGSSATIVLNTLGVLSGDSSAGSADAFQISGMGSGCQFRFGFLGGSPNCVVWALIG